ncbi:MAG: hypothetical protein ACPGRE_00805 [Flavobacteriaceae bacterium]
MKKKSILIALIIISSQLTLAQTNKWEVSLATGSSATWDFADGYFFSSQLKIPISKKIFSIAPTFSYGSSIKSDYIHFTTDKDGFTFTKFNEDQTPQESSGQIVVSTSVLFIFNFLNGKDSNRFNFNLGIGPSFKNWSQSLYYNHNGSTNSPPDSASVYSESELSMLSRIDLNYNLKNNIVLGINAAIDYNPSGSESAFGMFGIHIGYKFQQQKQTRHNIAYN